MVTDISEGTWSKQLQVNLAVTPNIHLGEGFYLKPHHLQQPFQPRRTPQGLQRPHLIQLVQPQPRLIRAKARPLHFQQVRPPPLRLIQHKAHLVVRIPRSQQAVIRPRPSLQRGQQTRQNQRIQLYFKELQALALGL